ncbi:glycosyltransferase family 39 protein [Actinopolymorpha pittospori]
MAQVVSTVSPTPPPTRSRRRRSPAAVAALALPVLCALVLHLWRIGTPALWLDEAATAQDTDRSLSSLVDFLSHRDAGLGAYYLLLHGWTRLGEGEAWLRLPSALAMVAAVALVADLARRWWGNASAVASGLLLALSPMASRYAQEARPYALALFLAVAAVWCLWRAGTRPGRVGRIGWVGYAVAVALLGVVHVFALLTLVAHPLLVAARRANGAGGTRPWKAWLVAVAAGLVAPALVGAAAFRQRATISWIEPPSLSTLGDAFTAMAGTTAFLVLLGTLAVLGLRRDRLSVALLAWFGLPPLLLALLGLLTPAFLPRYLLVCAPALALLAGAAFRRFGSWHVGLVGLLALAVAWVPLTQMREPAGHGPDYRSAARMITTDCRADDAVQETLDTVRALRYYLRDGSCQPRRVSGSLPASVHRVWVLQPDWQHTKPSGVTGLRQIRTQTFPGLRVSLWTRARTGAPGSG